MGRGAIRPQAPKGSKWLGKIKSHMEYYNLESALKQVVRHGGAEFATYLEFPCSVGVCDARRGSVTLGGGL